MARNRREQLNVSGTEEFWVAVRNSLGDMSRMFETGATSNQIEDALVQIRQIRTNCQRMSSVLTDFPQIYEYIQAVDEQLHLVETDQGNADTVSVNDVCTRSGVGRVQGGRGNPRYDIDATQLQNLLMTGFSVSRIARDGLLGQPVHRNTVVNHMRRHNIDHPRRGFTVAETDLRPILTEYIRDHPNSGAEEIRAHLRTRTPPIVVTRERVRTMVTEIDPVGVATRWSQVISRRRYNVPGPNSLWHIDSHHSLMRYGIYVHGCIDGSSRLVTYLKAAPYNTARVAFQAFLDGVRQYGVPSRIRVDGGVENGIIKRFMTEVNGEGRGSTIEGRSVHNQRIERLWRDVFQKVLFIFYQTLHALESSRALDITNPIHVFCAQTVFLPRINQALQAWCATRNNQPLRTEHNQTPEQPRMSRLMALRNSESTALRNIFQGRDIDSIVSQVLPEVHLDEAIFNQPRTVPTIPQETVNGVREIDLTKSVCDFGVGLYGEVLECVTRFQ